MEFRGAIPATLVDLVTCFYEEILLGPGYWSWHKLKGRNDPKPKITH